MRSWIFWLLFLFGFLFLGISLGFVIHYWSYYSLPAELRPAHGLHQELRPSGTIGLRCGVLGTFLMVLNLVYLARKRLPALEILGPLRAWMSLHIFTGLIAGALILFHSAFLLKSSLGILAFVSLLIVLATGLIGRYIYSWVPHTVEGREMEIEEIRQRLSKHRKELFQLGVDTALLEIGSPTAAGTPHVKGFSPPWPPSSTATGKSGSIT